MSRSRCVPTFLLAVLAPLGVAATAVAQTFTTFETGQVRPLALSPDGTRLFAINTPDNRLEIFDASGSTLTHLGAVPVGLEPIAVAARTNTEVWVVNHLSDSISIVDVGASPPHVVRTLLTCDEPRDIVFAGADRAFVTTARRGQNCPVAANLTQEGIGRAVVQVFDGPTLGAAGPVANIVLFGDTPRALAVAPGGGTVYAAVFHSGNQTTTISEGAVCNGGAGAAACNLDGVIMPGGLPGGQVPGGLPAPNQSCDGDPQPETGLIVRFDTSDNVWKDELGRNWNNAVRFSLPDEDVFAINATTLAPTGTPWAHVGTVLFNMIVNSNGKVYVSNTEARNEVRFEGPGTCSSTVRGHLHEARITVLDGANVLPRHLNKHLQPLYATPPTAPAEKAKSFATPLGMAINGTNLYVAAFGSSQVGVFDTAQIEADTFVPTAANHIPVSGGGPSGLAVKGAPANRLYVFTRFDNGISVIDTTSNTQIDHLALFNPEPQSVVDGRPVLYDAVLTSSNGEASCSTCHVFADFDSLAWDLGNPDETAPLPNPNPFEFPTGPGAPFAALKGPMTTQTLRGMANHGSMHWRGDRTGGTGGGDPLDEDAAFKKFIVAFDGLLGRGSPISDADMDRFTDFILQVVLPPNPIRSLTNSLDAPVQAARDLFEQPCVNQPSNPACTDFVRNCDGCHTLDAAQGFFGTQGRMSFEGETQDFKVPHLRNMYQKVGMFGMPDVNFFKDGLDNTDKGPQVRGFGFLHDGSVDTLFRFHQAVVFTLDVPQSQDMEEFMMQFDSNLAPMVGQQATLTGSNGGTVNPFLDDMIARAAAGDCEVVVKGPLGGVERGWYRLPNGTFQPDAVFEPTVSDATLRGQAAAGQERTYTCVPPGSGERVGVDRDLDGCFDHDESLAGSDPADASSNGCLLTALCGPAPAAGCRAATPGKSSIMLRAMSDPAKDSLRWRWKGGDTSLIDFKDPVNGSATYRVCIYDASADPQPLLEGDVPPGGTCGTQPCWKAAGPGGVRYRNKLGTPNGFTQMMLREGQAGKAQVRAMGKGALLPMPPLGLTLPVTVQLLIDDGIDQECWQAVYTTSKRNDPGQFRASGP